MTKGSLPARWTTKERMEHTQTLMWFSKMNGSTKYTTERLLV